MALQPLLVSSWHAHAGRRVRRGVWLLWWLLVFLVACSAPAPGESLAALRVDVPASVEVGGPVRVVVTAVGSRGTEPLPGYGGTATLEVDDGRLTPESVQLTNGSGDARVAFSRVVAPVRLTVRVGSVSASTTVAVLPLSALPGDASASAASRVPFIGYRPRPQDYALDAPDLPGLDLSLNTVTMIIDPMATVGEVNALLGRHGAVIVGAVPGFDGVHGPIVALRLPTEDHASMLVSLAALKTERIVEVVHREHRPPPPMPAEPSVTSFTIPDPNAGDPPGWTWELEADPQPDPDANWGLERIRVPQMWNLNAAASGVGRVPVGVLDSGFSDHPDLAFADRQGDYVRPVVEDNDHGLHVSGTIGASFRNGQGVDGVNPFAGLIARQYGVGLAWGMVDFIDDNPELRVVNVSLGMNWYTKTPAVNPADSAGMQAHMDALGETFAQFLGYLGSNGVAVPLIVAAAGNDSGKAVFGNAVIDSRWNSPFTNASVRNLTPHVLVVEAVTRQGDGSLVRAPFSNAAGTIAAPGVDIWSTSASLPYMPKQGTSMAAPHVAGVASFLFAIAPELTNAEVKEALVSTAEAVPGGTAPVVDAFAAAVALDTVAFGSQRVLRWLVDVDDGTLDGNARTTRTVDLDAETDGSYGPIGDGIVDMRDFRRWRDWMLQIEAAAALALDGAADHPKKDPNGNRIPGEDGKTENTFPRGDFNGDGVISRVLTQYVGGAVNAEVSDLDVLKILFVDPHYTTDDLDDLIDSGDLEIWPETLFERSDVASVVTTLRVEGVAEIVDQRTHTRASPRHVYTLSTTPGVYAATATARDTGGHVVATAEETFVIGLGSDAFWDPIGEGGEPAGNVELLSSRAAVRVRVNVDTTSLFDEESEEDFTSFTRGLTISASGTCWKDGTDVTATANASADILVRTSDTASRLIGFTGTTHVSHVQPCGGALAETQLDAVIRVSGGPVLMRVNTRYVADEQTPRAFAYVIIAEGSERPIVNTVPPAPAEFSDEYVLLPGEYGVRTGSFTRAAGDGPEHSVDQEFEISFEKVRGD